MCLGFFQAQNSLGFRLKTGLEVYIYKSLKQKQYCQTLRPLSLAPQWELKAPTSRPHNKLRFH